MHLKKVFILHPFLLAIFPILFLFSQNMAQLSLDVIVLPLAVTICFAFVLYFFLSFVLKDTKKSGLLVSLFLLMVFSYGHVYELLPKFSLSLPGITIGRNKVFFPLCSALFLVASRFLIKTQRNLNDVTYIVNYATACLVTISLVNIGVYQISRQSFPNHTNGTQNTKTKEAALVKTDTLPDIYYIVLERYASSNTLKESYGFNNKEFIKYLSKKGFYVAPRSRANYLGTTHSLASSLNMEYIGYLTDELGEESSDWGPTYAMLQNYQVWRFLKMRGYKFIHLGYWWPPTSQNRYADINVNPNALVKSFSMLAYKTTMFYPLAAWFGIYEERQGFRARSLYAFNTLPEIPNIKGPKFVFAHIFISHEPYLFDRNGKFLTEEEVNNRSEQLNYIDSIIFTNKKLKVLIDKILSSSGPQPVIILQSDEGPYPERPKLDPDNFDWRQATKAELGQKMGILNAYYLPYMDKDVLYSDITPVNSFRLIFNLYFDANLELLPDKSYVFQDPKHIYKFFDVTEKVK